MSYHANIVEIIWQNLAFLKVIIDTTFLDNSGKLIQKLAIFLAGKHTCNDIQSGKFYVNAQIKMISL